MRKYEAMFILRPDLSEDEKKNLFNQINDAVSKNNGTVTQASVWAERKKLFFSLKKYHEGMYYLLNFNLLPEHIAKIRHTYQLNENILRVLISVRE